MLINRNIVALFALPFMASATASELSIGAGAAYNESPYRGYNENTKAIPLIRIGEHVVLMASAGYSELPEEITNSPMIDRNESFTFVTGVSWRF